MPLRYYKCPLCDSERSTLKSDVPKCANERCDHTEMAEVLVAPEAKMMEVVDKEKGKSRIKDQMKILKARSRDYARDYEATDLIEINQKNGIERSGFLNREGKRRTKMDDK